MTQQPRRFRSISKRTTISNILIGIGTNLPDAVGSPPLVIAERAAWSLARIPGLRLIALSRWYRSAPIPPSGQPPYVNGVALVSGMADSVEVLAALRAIEVEAGRVRGVVNAARTLDLDLIDFAGEVRRSPNLVLPHPRAHLRAFVLLPLAEVCPYWVHPVLQRSVAELIAALPPQEICAI